MATAEAITLRYIVTIDGALNMDSGNISEVDSEVTKPEEAVAAEAEGKLDEQQSSEEETELFIEEEGEQSETPKEHGMTEQQARAAQKQDRAKWKKERAAKQEAEDRANKSEIEKAELLDRIAKLESGAEKASKGARPNPLDYSNEEEFYSDLDKWNGKPEAAKKVPEAAPVAMLSDDQAYHLYKSEEAIKSSFKDYGEVVSKAEEALKGAGVDDVDLAMKQVAAVCHENDIDTAKVKYALGRFPDQAEELIEATKINPSAVNTVLRKLESKVKSRTRKKIDSEPEPKVKSTGAVDIGSEAEKKAMADYIASGHSIEKYKVLQKIRKANKA